MDQPGIVYLPNFRSPPVCQVPGPGAGVGEGAFRGEAGGVGDGLGAGHGVGTGDPCFMQGPQERRILTDITVVVLDMLSPTQGSVSMTCMGGMGIKSLPRCRGGRTWPVKAICVSGNHCRRYYNWNSGGMIGKNACHHCWSECPPRMLPWC